MSELQPTLTPLRTWSHLASRRKRPSEYEIVSTNLHYTTDNKDAPFELDPDYDLAQWYKRYRNESALRFDDWNAFRDPDELVYRTYNILRMDRKPIFPASSTSFPNAATMRCSIGPGRERWRASTRRHAICFTACNWRQPT
jgi:hypothetical protein